MPAEIFNVDELADIAAAATYHPTHAGLLGALRARYPGSALSLIASLGPWSRDADSLVDLHGNPVTDHFRQWIKGEYHKAGDDAKAVYAKHKDAGLRISEVNGDTAIITVPFDSQPDGFLQIEVEADQVVAERALFDDRFPPADLQDLLHPFSMVSRDTIEISPWQYRFQRVTNIRRFCQEMAELHRMKRRGDLAKMAARKVRIIEGGEPAPHITGVPFLELYPDWLAQPMKEIRLLADWRESSAGRGGHRFCDHWWLKLGDCTYQGERHMDFIPYWAAADGGLELPSLSASEYDSVFDLMSELEKFDKRTGYPFSWFFYMVHGNRMGTEVGRRVVEAVTVGKVGLPEPDRRVLLRWSERGYGF